MRVLVVGLGATGDAVVRFASSRGDDVTVVEDEPAQTAVYAERRSAARAAGATVVEQADAAVLAELAARADVVVPSPGVPERHPLIAAARRAHTPVRSEIDLAAEVAAARGVTLLAVTGTNGKTTVTTLAARMFEAAGRRVLAAGNIGLPLLDAALADAEILVAEVSSFQLELTTPAFRPVGAAFLNVADDHLDWHRTSAAYVNAKARVFAHQTESDLLIFNADDPVVAGLASNCRARRVPFSVAPGAAAGARVVETADGQVLVDSAGELVVEVDGLPRRGPTDLANALAASALAIDNGVPHAVAAEVLRSFGGLPHRLQDVVELGGVRYVNDSKATNVHAAVAAVRNFEHVVLIAGGRNKGLDLGALREVAGRLRAVVAIGEAAAEVRDALADLRPVVIAGSMRDAVLEATRLSVPGDVVLLAPGCASFDWYSSYAERGDDFSDNARSLGAASGREPGIPASGERDHRDRREL